MERTGINQKKIRLYLLPGLGADSRIFNRLPKLDHVEWHPLDWVDPGEVKTARDYAALLHEHYSLEAPYALGGVSLGGIIAQEWARLTSPEAVVLISTLTARSEMPPVVRASGKMGFHRMMNKRLLVGLGKIADKFTFKSPEGRELFVDMLRNSSESFLRFGTTATFSWHEQALHVPVLRIHGDRDMVFPRSRIDKAETIRGGNHYMVYEKAEEVAEIVEGFFRELG